MRPVAMTGARSVMFITLEGPEGAGKSTQAAHLGRQLEARGYQVRLTREPGGTALGEQVRELLLAIDGQTLNPWTEAFLICAARSVHVAQVIRPALAAGQIVLCDRFSDATLAYQGYGSRLPISSLRRMNAWATDSLTPDLTLLLDLPVEVGLSRRRRNAAEWTRFDDADLAFHHRVRRGYRALARREPQRWHIIDAAGEPEEVAAAIWRAVASRLPGLVADSAGG